MAAVFEAISRRLAQISAVLVVGLAGLLVGSLLVAIFFRYVVGQALSWPEEISLILFCWLVLLAGSLGVREGFHVKLTILTSRLPTGLQRRLEQLVTLSIGGFGAVVVYSGYDLVERTARHLTPTLRLPLDLLNYSAPVCGALIVIHALSVLLKEEGKTAS